MSPLSIEEFEKQMGRLGRTYGPKAFTDERRKLMWRYVKDIPARSFALMVDRIIEQERYAPMPKIFKEMAWKVKAELGIEIPAWPKKAKPSDEAKCHWCGDSGSLFIETKPEFNFMHATIRCDCKAGRYGPESWGPCWSSSLRSTWFRIAIYPDGHGDWSPNTPESMQDKIETMADLMETHELNQKQVKRKSELISFSELFNGVGR